MTSTLKAYKRLLTEEELQNMRSIKACVFIVVVLLGVINVAIFFNLKSEKNVDVGEILITKKKYLEPTVEKTHTIIVNTTTELRATQKIITNQTQNNSVSKSNNYVIPVLIMACNRASAVQRSLEQVLKLRPSEKNFPVIVSQDCSDRQTTKVIASYGKKIKFIKQPDLSRVQSKECHHPMAQSYCKISRHYKWALNQVLEEMGYDSCIVLEDDLDIAPDFFEYFASLRPLLDSDPSIFCISAWNDNGKIGMVKGNNILYRTDFFPGLGWMLRKSLWDVLKPKWPAGYWDDWLRKPEQRRGRACIRPEISRTKTFGEIGVSRGQFYQQYLKYIQLNEESYPFREHDLSYLEKNKYDKEFLPKVYSLPLVTLGDVQSSTIPEVRLQYSSEQEFIRYASHFGIMKDFKSGIPRTGYKGIVSFVHQGIRIFLAPAKHI